MPFQRGTATDYRDFLDQIDIFVTGRHVATVAINAGGTGYVVGDLLSIAGGTVSGGLIAKLEVTSEAAGVIDGIRIYDAGSYSVDPTPLTANIATGGTGTGATFDITAADTGWTNRIKNIQAATSVMHVTAGTITVNGISYTAGDVVTLADPISSVAKATFTIDTVDGSGNVLTISVLSKGDYNSSASGSFATTGGTGTGLTIDPVFEPVDDEYMWEGVGTGGNAVFVSAESQYAVTEDQRGILLDGYTGWNGSSILNDQPGKGDIAAYLLLSQNSFNFWIRANNRSIMIVADILGNQQSGHMGLLDPYGTDTEIPFPLYICGTSDVIGADVGTPHAGRRSIADPMRTIASTSILGPGGFREGGSSWEEVENGFGTASAVSSTTTLDYFIYPFARPDRTNMAGIDRIADITGGEGTSWEDVIPPTRTGTPTLRWRPYPGTGGNRYTPIACVLMRSPSGANQKAVGLINGLFFVSAEDGLQAGDKITVGTDVYRVFQMGNNSVSYAHFCILEN